MPSHRIQSVSVVVPCFRSGAWIERLVEEIAKATEPWHGRRELVLVDDASPDDDTWRALKRLASHYDWVHAVRLQFNVGQYRALMAGLERTSGEWVVTLDDDFQTPPREIPRLVAAAEAHPEMDAIIGAPTHRPESAIRVLGSKLMGLLQERLEGKPHELKTSAFRLLRRELVDAMLADGGLRPQIGPLILNSTSHRRILNVPVDREERCEGRSGYTPGALVNLVIDSALPHVRALLRTVGLAGVVVLAGSALLGALRAFGIGVAPGLGVPLLLLIGLGGLGLVGIALLGELAHRVLVEVSGGPRHHVREEVGPRARRASP